RAYPWYALCELTSARAAEPLDALLQEALGEALAQGAILDAVLARSERERGELWKMRETLPEAQRKEGAGLKHDISVPVAALPQFVARAAQWLTAHVPEGRLVAYGHVGDGNLHFNLNAVRGAAVEPLLRRGPQVRRAV